MASHDRQQQSVVIVGGGLVGSLCACFLAKRNYKVTVYEFRGDLRKVQTLRGRSINLALSHRGRLALRSIQLEDEILSMGVPMKGRYLHCQNGKNKNVPYDAVGKQCIYSVSRNFLNSQLLTAAERFDNVKIIFKHKVVNANLERGSVTVHNLMNGEYREILSDLIIGADGAYSVIRRHMQQTPLFELSQSYIEHGYLELYIPASRGANTLMPNHLHIWPRGQFMMIALPNYDGSWTVTLFMPFKSFDALNADDNQLMPSFFRTTFPDAVDAIGESSLRETFRQVQPSALVSIKCSRYHAYDKCLIVGDAAHAMVPFYGQGMNAGFEDCNLFMNLLDECHDDIGMAIKRFSKLRVNDAHTICDLAVYNYLEMRDLVTRPSFMIRKKVDELLFRVVPRWWIPLYNSVTFTSLGYRQCIDNRKWQDKMLKKILLAGGVLIAGVIIALCTRFTNVQWRDEEIM